MDTTQTTHTSVPPIVESAVSDVRDEADPVSQQRAAEIHDDKLHRGTDQAGNAGFTSELGRETPAALSTQGAAQAVVEPTAALRSPETPDAGDKMDITVDAPPEQPTPHVAHSQPEADGSAAAVPSPAGRSPLPAQSAALPATSGDQVMGEAPSPGKNVRAREDDDEDERDDGPAAKRSRIVDDGAVSADFKVPALPPLTTSLPAEPEPTSAATTAAPQQSPADGSRAITRPQHKFLLSAVRNLKRTKDAHLFTAPVDHVKMNIPTYPTIVTKPMDLGTMEDRLKNEKYATVDEVTADFNQIITNTTLFNGEEHPVTRAAKNMKGTFDRQLSNLPRPDVVEPTPAEKKAKKAGAPKTGPARRESRSSTGVAKSPTAPSAGAGSPTTFALGPSGTPLIRRDSTVGDGRPKREIHPPRPRDLPYSASKPKKKKYQWELKFCQEALNELLKPKYDTLSSPFRAPVDPVALNIPHYHKIVKKPMDLSTIGTKLRNGQYENAKEFEADVRLMFQNCYKFNPKGDPINNMGRQLEIIFDDKWAQKAQWIDDHAPASGPPSLASSPEPDDDDDDDDDEEDEEDSRIDMIQQQIEAMKEQVELMRKKKMSPAAGGKKAAKAAKATKKAKKPGLERSSSKAGAARPDKKKKKSGKKERTPYITYEQKQEISNRINTLPPNRMTTALKIIRDNMPNLKVSGAATGLTGAKLTLARASRTTSWSSTLTSCRTKCCTSCTSLSKSTRPAAISTRTPSPHGPSRKRRTRVARRGQRRTSR